MSSSEDPERTDALELGARRAGEVAWSYEGTPLDGLKR